MRNIAPFDPKHWPALEKEGWTLGLFAPPYYSRPEANRATPVKKYIGQTTTDQPIIETLQGLIQITYCLFMLEPERNFLRYRRYITTACYGSEPTVFCWNEGTPKPDPKGFVAWIDQDWQKANLP